MRILSQNGEYDLPYEKIVIERVKATILAECDSQDLNNRKEIATYSTEDKAKEAMEILHIAYINNKMYTNMTNEQRHLVADDILKKIPKEEICKSMNELFGIFQFPEDKEI